jgi:hypothetical protein
VSCSYNCILYAAHYLDAGIASLRITDPLIRLDYEAFGALAFSRTRTGPSSTFGPFGAGSSLFRPVLTTTYVVVDTIGCTLVRPSA